MLRSRHKPNLSIRTQTELVNPDRKQTRESGQETSVCPVLVAPQTDGIPDRFPDMNSGRKPDTLVRAFINDTTRTNVPRSKSFKKTSAAEVFPAMNGSGSCQGLD